jgi:hypothetical protein
MSPQPRHRLRRTAPKRMALAGIFVVLSLGQAVGNETSEKIAALADDSRNEFWTLYLQQSGRACDAVTQSMFQGGSDDSEDVWSVACRDGNSYSVGIAPGPEGTTTLMSCDEATATDAMLLKLSGSKSASVRCWKPLTQ